MVINVYLIDDSELKLKKLESIFFEISKLAPNREFIDGFNGMLLEEVKKRGQDFDPHSIARLIWESTLEAPSIFLLDLRFDSPGWDDDVSEALEDIIKKSSSEAFQASLKYYEALGNVPSYWLSSLVMGLLEFRNLPCVIVSTQALDQYATAKEIIDAAWFTDVVVDANPHSPKIVAEKMLELLGDEWANANFSYRAISRVPNNEGSSFFEPGMPHAPAEWSLYDIHNWKERFECALTKFIRASGMECALVFPDSDDLNRYWPLRFLYGRHREKLHPSFLMIFSSDWIPEFNQIPFGNIYVDIPMMKSGAVIYSFYILLCHKRFLISSALYKDSKLVIALEGVPEDGDVNKACGDLEGTYRDYMRNSDGSQRDGGGLAVRAAEELRAIIGDDNLSVSATDNLVRISITFNAMNFRPNLS